MTGKLRAVWSGGQTGADRTALECAKELGLETGGWVPKGCRTETGIDKSLLDFGCKEAESIDYAVRTKLNVRDTEATFWFGSVTSPGYWCTKNAAKLWRKPFFENPGPLEFRLLVQNYTHVNIAGNRESTNPAVVKLVKEAFAKLKEE